MPSAASDQLLRVYTRCLCAQSTCGKAKVKMAQPPPPPASTCDIAVPVCMTHTQSLVGSARRISIPTYPTRFCVLVMRSHAACAHGRHLPAKLGRRSALRDVTRCSSVPAGAQSRAHGRDPETLLASNLWARSSAATRSTTSSTPCISNGGAQVTPRPYQHTCYQYPLPTPTPRMKQLPGF